MTPQKQRIINYLNKIITDHFDGVQAQFASFLDTSPQRVCSWLKGGVMMHPTMILALYERLKEERHIEIKPWVLSPHVYRKWMFIKQLTLST